MMSFWSPLLVSYNFVIIYILFIWHHIDTDILFFTRLSTHYTFSKFPPTYKMTLIFICILFTGEAGCISNFYVFPTWHLEHPHSIQPTLLSTGYNLDLTMKPFVYLPLLYQTIKMPSQVVRRYERILPFSVDFLLGEFLPKKNLSTLLFITFSG